MSEISKKKSRTSFLMSLLAIVLAGLVIIFIVTEAPSATEAPDPKVTDIPEPTAVALNSVEFHYPYFEKWFDDNIAVARS